MNAAKPPPPPHRSGTSRPPTPPPVPGAASTHPPIANGSAPAPPLPTNRPVPPSVPSHANAAPGGSVPPAVSAPTATPGFQAQVRVSVKLSVRDPQLILARPLAPGQAAPPGTREAILVLADPTENPGGGEAT
jgi:hypothetical protein